MVRLWTGLGGLGEPEPVLSVRVHAARPSEVLALGEDGHVPAGGDAEDGGRGWRGRKGRCVGRRERVGGDGGPNRGEVDGERREAHRSGRTDAKRGRENRTTAQTESEEAGGVGRGGKERWRKVGGRLFSWEVKARFLRG